jgi:hypothetical protein
MEYMKSSFLAEEKNDDYVNVSNVRVDDKMAVATKMADASKRALMILQNKNVSSESDLYFVWLFVKRGDLEGREDREGYMMDGAQRNQVRAYIHEVFGTLITEAEVNSAPFVFDNVWKFFQVHDCAFYRNFTSPCNAPLQPELTTLWTECDANKRTCAEILNARASEFTDRFEDFYYVRGLSIAKTDVQNISKNLGPYAKKTYNVARGFERFQKLLKNHGPRPELLEQQALFEKLVVQYVPVWILENDARIQASENHNKPLPPGIHERIVESLAAGKEYLQKICTFECFDVEVDHKVFARAQEIVDKY